MNKKLNILDIIEAHYLSQLLIYVNSKGFLVHTNEIDAASLSDYDRHILQFLKDRSDIIIGNRDNEFALNPVYNSYLRLPFHIDKFLEAYGKFDITGKRPQIVLDQKKFSDAYQRATEFQKFETELSIFAAIKTKTLLDLGCGAGSLIAEFCKLDKRNRAIGIDQNVYLNKVGRSQIKKLRLTKRVSIINGNVKNFHRLLSPEQITAIDTIWGSSIFNEFCSSPTELISILKNIRLIFSGKILVISDYYGVFNTKRAANKSFQHSYVHDIMQIFSGQGVPPVNCNAWNGFYVKANCELLHVYEGKNSGVNWFIHILRLRT